MRRTLLLLLVLGAGCPAAHEPYPSTTCKVDTDCYEGERCVKASGAESGRCQAGDTADLGAP